MKTFNLTLNEEEMKVVISSLERHKQDMAKGLKSEEAKSPIIARLVRDSFEESAKIQAYLKYKLNESEKEAKDYERL